MQESDVPLKSGSVRTGYVDRGSITTTARSRVRAFSQAMRLGYKKMGYCVAVCTKSSHVSSTYPRSDSVRSCPQVEVPFLIVFPVGRALFTFILHYEVLL